MCYNIRNKIIYIEIALKKYKNIRKIFVAYITKIIIYILHTIMCKCNNNIYFVINI